MDNDRPTSEELLEITEAFRKASLDWLETSLTNNSKIVEQYVMDEFDKAFEEEFGQITFGIITLDDIIKKTPND